MKRIISFLLIAAFSLHAQAWAGPLNQTKIELFKSASKKEKRNQTIGLRCVEFKQKICEVFQPYHENKVRNVVSDFGKTFTKDQIGEVKKQFTGMLNTKVDFRLYGLTKEIEKISPLALVLIAAFTGGVGLVVLGAYALGAVIVDTLSIPFLPFIWGVKKLKKRREKRRVKKQFARLEKNSKKLKAMKLKKRRLADFIVYLEKSIIAE